MPRFFIILLSLLFLTSLVWAAQEEGQPFALVELFTSEGCSSCPPADILLSKLVASAKQNDLHLYPISLHVDYWNRLGWRDPFSQKQFTQRQQEYAKSFNSGKVATPQFVINGSQYVFSADGPKLQNAVNKALNEQSSASLVLSIVKTRDGHLRVGFVYQGDFTDKVLNVVLVERVVSMEVASGENAGRKLKHNNVARQWQTMPLTQARGQVDLNYPQAKPWEDFSLIAFVQDSQSMEIQAANQINIQD